MRTYLKISVLAWTLLAWTYSLYAQGESEDDVYRRTNEVENAESHPLGLLGTSAGVCFPLGVFNAEGLNVSGSGYARTGYSINFLETARFLTHHFGLGVRWSRHQMGYDFEALEVEFDQIRTDYDFVVEPTSPWIIHTALANLIGHADSKHIGGDIRFGLGYAYVQRPEILVEGYYKANGYFAYSWHQLESKTNTVVIDLGTNIRFHIDKDIDVMVCADLQRMDAFFTIDEINARSYEDVEERTQPITLVSLGAGIAIRL